MKKHLTGLSIGLLAFMAGCWAMSFMQVYVGRTEAYLDIWQGRRQLKRCIGWCVQAEYVRGYEKMIVDRFDTETILLKDEPCFNDRVRGYNQTQAEEIDRIYGEGSFNEAGEKYMDEWKTYLRRIEEQEQSISR